MENLEDLTCNWKKNRDQNHIGKEVFLFLNSLIYEEIALPLCACVFFVVVVVFVLFFCFLWLSFSFHLSLFFSFYNTIHFFAQFFFNFHKITLQYNKRQGHPTVVFGVVHASHVWLAYCGKHSSRPENKERGREFQEFDNTTENVTRTSRVQKTRPITITRGPKSYLSAHRDPKKKKRI